MDEMKEENLDALFLMEIAEIERLLRHPTDSAAAAAAARSAGRQDGDGGEAMAVQLEDNYDPVWRNPRTGEVGGPRGPEPTRFGDYAFAGRVSDF